MKQHLDKASGITVIVTLVLFVIALFAKGFTHDLLLEAGVFLVSVKLIIAGYKNEQANRQLLERIDRIDTEIKKITTDNRN